MFLQNHLLFELYLQFRFLMDQEYTFDFFVIGGGSGGMAAAKEAANLGAKVGLADFVKPSPLGTKWGLGGTCVNVGCIPKKLFHYAGLVGEQYTFLHKTGWDVPEDQKPQHKWNVMVDAVNNHIRSLNFGYKKQLTTKSVQYYNKLAYLKSDHEIELTAKSGEKQTVTAKYILIATGGRPTYPDIPGARQLCLTSDDIFWKQQRPGKTLVVGASYIALECAGFLHALGIDVTVMVRSIFLRGFDQQMSNKVGDYMAKTGVKFIRNSVPTSVQKIQNQQGDWKLVKYQTTEDGNTTNHEDRYQTILFAIGRTADTPKLGIQNASLKASKTGKLLADDRDQTSTPNVYAIGDVVEGRLELTPTAIMAGKLLARRLFAGSKIEMNYRYVPTTVFTPLEYGCCGYSEEAAIKEFGKENVVAYGSKYKPLEWAYDELSENDCYAKVVIQKNSQLIANRVIGFHYLGPNAGEVTQGFGVAIKKGISKEQLDLSVGIHPTAAEVIFSLQEIIHPRVQADRLFSKL